MQSVSTIAQIARLQLENLKKDRNADELAHKWMKSSEEVAEFKHEMFIMERRAKQDKETSLQMKSAEHEADMAHVKRAHSDLAEHLITKYVEKELKALGATAALDEFRANRRQRRQEVAKVFRCDNNDEDGATLRRATKRRQEFDDKQVQDVECKRQRVAEMHRRWADDWAGVEENKMNQEESIAHHKKTIAEEDEKARKEFKVMCAGMAKINTVARKEKKPVSQRQFFLAERKKELHWAPRFIRHLRTTEPDEEVNIPIFGDDQADFREDDEGRHYPLNWERPAPEQHVQYIIYPNPEIITLD